MFKNQTTKTGLLLCSCFLLSLSACATIGDALHATLPDTAHPPGDPLAFDAPPFAGNLKKCYPSAG